MADASPPTILLGGSPVTLTRMKVFKATEMAALVTRLATEYEAVEGEAQRYVGKYREENTIIITRAAAEFRYPEMAAAVTEDAWQAANQRIELPQDPTGDEVGTYVMTRLFERAKVGILELLALAITSDSALADADDAGREVLGKEGAIGPQLRLLKHEAEPQELIELAKAVWTLVRTQLGPEAERLGEVGRRLAARAGLDTTQTVDPTSPTPEPSEQPSSTTSRGPTTGRAAKRSTGSRGKRRVASAAA